MARQARVAVIGAGSWGTTVASLAAANTPTVLWARRDGTFANLGDVSQTRATVGLYYAYLGRERFGAVDWR